MSIRTAYRKFAGKTVPKTWFPPMNKLEEYLLGSGMCGKVLATQEEEVVIKITSDPSEIKFVQHAQKLSWPEGIVHFYAWDTYQAAQHQNWVFWREPVIRVGYPEGQMSRLLNRLRDRIYEYYYDELNLVGGQRCKEIKREIDKEIGKLKEDEDLWAVGEALEVILASSEVEVLSDVHADNVGIVDRNGEQLWVITDVGIGCEPYYDHS